MHKLTEKELSKITGGFVITGVSYGFNFKKYLKKLLGKR